MGGCGLVLQPTRWGMVVEDCVGTKSKADKLFSKPGTSLRHCTELLIEHGRVRSARVRENSPESLWTRTVVFARRWTPSLGNHFYKWGIASRRPMSQRINKHENHLNDPSMVEQTRLCIVWKSKGPKEAN